MRVLASATTFLRAKDTAFVFLAFTMETQTMRTAAEETASA
jgi:hypothetical protein